MWALNSSLLHLYNTESLQYKKKNEPKVLLFSWLPLTCWHVILKYLSTKSTNKRTLQKGGVPAAPSGTATLLRLSPNHQFCPRPILAVTDFRHPRLSWLDGRCVQGPGTYSPRHGWCAITSESSFVGSGCRPQSELGPAFKIWCNLHYTIPLYRPL